MTPSPDRAPDAALDRAPDEVAAVAELLGRRPQGAFVIAVRAGSGAPVVIRNAPFLDDGTPMPTRFWLVDPALSKRVGTLESEGGVRQAEAEVAPAELIAAHSRYARERDAAIPAGWSGPRPSGGVGGTRLGVKCLHAHLAWFLAGGNDPVGRWTARRLSLTAPSLDGMSPVDAETPAEEGAVRP